VELFAYQRDHPPLVYVGVIGFVLDRIVAGIATAVTHGTAAN
jgi:hypothetical protein